MHIDEATARARARLETILSKPREPVLSARQAVDFIFEGFAFGALSPSFSVFVSEAEEDHVILTRLPAGRDPDPFARPVWSTVIEVEPPEEWDDAALLSLAETLFESARQLLRKR
ncbi:hypothetical protein [Miltoncostaea oceani]|uniref:hypothetical protein n=1 Tax=Miltoncostaea oceani TaxID=2843216 RepID=UPI001C3D1BA2|nr:hypothetical protein [Miltoncostaea oceani]